jgi:hypothetical protein
MKIFQIRTQFNDKTVYYIIQCSNDIKYDMEYTINNNDYYYYYYYYYYFY